MTRAHIKHKIAVISTAFAILLLSIVESAAQTQTARATISGLVRDAAGNPVASATVTLNTAAGVAKWGLTEQAGTYRLTDIAPGTYFVILEAPGFQTSRYSNLRVTAAEALQFDFKLQAGATSSIVELDINARSAPAPSVANSTS